MGFYFENKHLIWMAFAVCPLDVSLCHPEVREVTGNRVFQ